VSFSETDMLPQRHADECYRCGYALVGIADDQACPECGLLAERSRRVTEELHNTRPRWLRQLSLGTSLILLALLMLPLSPAITVAVLSALRSSGQYFYLSWQHAKYAGLDGFAVLLLLGTLSLTRPEQYDSADRADRNLRRALRICAAAVLLALAMLHLDSYLMVRSWSPFTIRQTSYAPRWSSLALAAAALAAAAGIALPLLLFRHLRGLAKRARSAHLAEHCTIVGIGTSLSLVYAAIVWLIIENAERAGLGQRFINQSNAWLVLMLILLTAGGLFILWSLYLLTRFAIAFHIAARKLRKQWRRDDRAIQ
jgi:hypothetical protein